MSQINCIQLGIRSKEKGEFLYLCEGLFNG